MRIKEKSRPLHTLELNLFTAFRGTKLFVASFLLGVCCRCSVALVFLSKVRLEFHSRTYVFMKVMRFHEVVANYN